MSKIVRSIALLYLVLLAGFTISMIAVHTIPRSAIQKHFVRSVEQLEQEGDYPYVSTMMGRVKLDNFTDCYMHNVAYCADSSHPVDAAMRNYRYRDHQSMIVTMRHLADGEMTQQPFEYGKYWHGYQVFLRPLLTVIDYRGIRIVNGIVLSVLLLVALSLMWRRLSATIVGCFVVSLVMVHSEVLPWSLQFSTCYYITLVSIILLLGVKRFTATWRNLLMSFFAIGAFTAFFDFLTTPTMTLGIPLAVMMLKDKTSGRVKLLVGLTLAWGVGYVGLWVSKWALAYLLAGYNPMGQVDKSMHIHSVGNMTETVWTMWGKLLAIFQMRWSLGYAHGLLSWTIVVVMVALALIASRGRAAVKRNTALLAVAMITPLWYAVVVHHSYSHFFITSRALMVCWFANLCFLCQIIDFQKLKSYVSIKR